MFREDGSTMDRDQSEHNDGNLSAGWGNSRESTPADDDDDFQSATNSNENLFQALQIFILRQNARLLRRLSLQASIATTDFDTFRRWIYQDYEQHRSQLREASANLFFRNESKDNIPDFDIVITFERGCDPGLVSELQRALLKDHPTFSVQHRKHYFANYVEQSLYVSARDDIAIIDDDTTEPDGSPQQHSSSLHRQTFLHDILQQWHFELNQEKDDESFPCLAKYLSSGDSDCTITSLIKAKVISQFFPLHCDETLSSLKNEWVYQFLSAQPLEAVCHYFGIRIAIYFAFIGFYTHYLLYPTLFGLLVTYFPMLYHSNISWCSWLFLINEDLLIDILRFFFTIFNIIWSGLLLQKWQVKCQQHVTSWSRLVPFEFALWHGKRYQKTDQPNDGGFNRIIFKYCVTFPALACSLAITFAIMFQIFHFQTWWDSELIEKQAYPSWTRFVPKVLLATILNGSNCIYYLIAVWLNDKEKYINSELRENNLIIKLVLFLNSFLPLFFIAFYQMDMDKLQEQLAVQLITRQVIGNFSEAIFPFLRELYRITTRKMQRTDQRHNDDKMSDMVSKGELESCMFQYESTFDDYLELVVQFGYVMLFAPVFPLAALFALLNNLLEIRSDAFKMCFVFQRPFASNEGQVNSIGEWQNVLNYLSIAAIATNCALMAVTGQVSRVFGFSNSAHIILTSVAIEHALLLMKWLIPNLI